MHTRLLIDAIARQTTVLLARLSTAAGIRAPLAHVVDEVFIISSAFAPRLRETLRLVSARRPLPLIAVVALFACACASESAEEAKEASVPEAGAPSRDASLEAPIEANPITLTRGPFWDITIDADGFATPVPLGGVEVCLEKRRGYEEPWEAFVPVDRTEWPCAITVEGENVVLEVPALSELLLTAKKEGFVPRVLPVETGQWDQGGSAGVYEMHLFRPEDLRAMLPGADLALGILATFVVEDFARFGAGYQPRIEPDAGSLVQTLGGLVYPDAGASLPGQIFSSPGVANPRDYAISAFFNLPENEYALSWYREGMSCGPNPVAPGFADAREGVRRAPVLKGHYTMIGASCSCRVPPDALTCSSGDGGP